jgi:CHAD domain-containing protein
MIAVSGRPAIRDRDGGTRRLRAVLAADRTELVALLPALSRLRPGAVHRARVLARRQRSLLRAYAPAFERTHARSARRALKSLAAVLDGCREVDVRKTLLGELAAGRESSAATSDALTAQLARARAEARRTARRRLVRPEFTQALREALDGLAVADGLCVDWMLARVERRGRALERRERDARGTAGLHRLRLAVKSLRYSLAPLEDLAPGLCSRLLERLRDAQDRLGEQHDASLAIRWLESGPSLHQPGSCDLLEALQRRERVSRRLARRAARHVRPAWRDWRDAVRNLTAAP